MRIDEIKKILAKKATGFKTGGFKPTNAINESWIGRVYLYVEGEEIPIDNNGNLMIPLFQLCLDGLPYIPPILADTKAITVFISEKLPMNLTQNGNNWVLREYKKSDIFFIKDLKNDNARIKPFPLSSYLIEEDYPVWDGGGIPDELADEILELEDSGEIDDYFDIVENHYEHKVGGYPTFCQLGIDFGEGFEFAFQISSDEKAGLNIVDTGTIFLAKNAGTGEWVYYCDFY